MGRALCAQSDPDLFFPEGSGSSVRNAKKICAVCPVRPQCADHALHLEGNTSAGHRHGAWGGMAPRQRADAGGTPKHVTRDQLVLRLTARGMTPTVIAEQLGCSTRTVLRARAAHRKQEEAA